MLKKIGPRYFSGGWEVRINRAAGTPRLQLQHPLRPAPPEISVLAPLSAAFCSLQGAPHPTPPLQTICGLCRYGLQAARGKGHPPSHSPTRLGCKSQNQKSEPALTPQDKEARKWDTRKPFSRAELQALCLKIQPTCKHTLSTRLKIAGKEVK